MPLNAKYETVKLTPKQDGPERDVKIHIECLIAFNKFVKSPDFLRAWSKDAHAKF